jgi:putative redox protein
MADISVQLKWSGDGLLFDGGAVNGPQVRLDGNSVTGPSPMTALLLALGGCMAADIVDISVKSRTAISALDVTVEGDRATEMPRRFTRIAMRFIAHGVAAGDEPKLQRALDLSREKYCSVLHTLRPDLDIAFDLKRA